MQNTQLNLDLIIFKLFFRDDLFMFAYWTVDSIVKTEKYQIVISFSKQVNESYLNLASVQLKLAFDFMGIRN